MRVLKNILPAVGMAIFLGACSNDKNGDDQQNGDQLQFSPDNGSLELPAGFQAVVVADNTGGTRHLVVDQDGDIYVNLVAEKNGKGLVALRDTDGDGVADEEEYFGEGGGTGIRLHNGYLYYSNNNEVHRQKFNGDELVPSGQKELILSLPAQSSHPAKAIDFDGQGNMYISIGAPVNACQDPPRTVGAPGQDPCPLLDNHGGIWKFSDSQANQQRGDGTRYATGIRHAVGMSWNDQNNTLYAMQHGRDQLHEFWPEHFSEAENAELPAEQMLEVQQGDNFGWPYCYYDQNKEQKLLNPEYGGDGDSIGRCNQYEDPVMAFPGHWAPNDLQFYNGNSFPQEYRGAAVIAFHGSWNRAPLPQRGYKVVFVPFENGSPAGSYEDFATQFAGDGGPVDHPNDAEYRPCGVAVGPDGSLYICDSKQGRIWRVVYTG